MIFNFTLKLLELFKHLRLVFHQVNIPISTQIISEGKKIAISTARFNTHWIATSTCIVSNKSLARFIISENGVLVILPKRHGPHVSTDSKSRESKDPSAWSFFMRFTPI